MGKKLKCWDTFKCKEEECPVYKTKDLKCWLITETHCRQEIQGKFIEKMEMCLDCIVFKENMDIPSMKETLTILNKQFKKFRTEIMERDNELEGISMELALGLSEGYEALNKIASGDPRVKISEFSENELIVKLKQTINRTAEGIEAIVDQSHEFAIGLAEHFDVLHKVSKGKLDARISDSSGDDLLKALGQLTNKTIQNVSREINKRKQVEKRLRSSHKQLRDLVSEITLIEERERRKLAIELHDQVGQILAMTKIKLGAMKLISPTLFNSHIDEITLLIDEAIQYTRSLTFELSLPILYELGLEAALEWLAEQIQKQYDISIDFEKDKYCRPLDNDVRVLLFLAVRELLVNIVKHAQAQKAKVGIHRVNNTVRIIVSDDGVGFDTSKIRSGFGLFSIRERLNHLGGKLEVKSQPNKGTQVTLTALLTHKKESLIKVK